MEATAVKPNTRSISSLILALSLVILLGGSYAAWTYFDAPPLDRYTALITGLAAHQIPHDDEGRIDLSRSYPGLTPKDVAYVNFQPDGSFLALFPTHYGEGAEMSALLYTSRPLNDSDTHYRDGAYNFAERLIGVGTYANLLLEKQINPSWYHVSYKLR